MDKGSNLTGKWGGFESAAGEDGVSTNMKVSNPVSSMLGHSLAGDTSVPAYRQTCLGIVNQFADLIKTRMFSQLVPI